MSLLWMFKKRDLLNVKAAFGDTVELGAIQHTINYLDALKERFKAAEATSQSSLVTYLC